MYSTQIKGWRKKHREKKQAQKKLQLQDWWRECLAGTLTIQEYQKREKEVLG